MSKQPKNPTRYDELHDRYSQLLSSKAGTRYERLAALVFKSLEKQNVVIHDLKLAGRSKAKHQIDVTIDKNGGAYRVLIECKDFDVSGKMVGLGIIRDFFGVIHDTKPDAAIVLACTGFTKDAKKYANANDINLGVLRVFEQSDWEGRIKKIIYTAHLQVPPDILDLSIAFDQPEKGYFDSDIAALGLTSAFTSEDDVALIGPAGREHILTVAQRLAEEKRSGPGDADVLLAFSPSDWQIQVGSQPVRQFTELKIKMRIFGEVCEQRVIENDRIAELILHDFSGNEVIVFSDQLEQLEMQGGKVSIKT